MTALQLPQPAIAHGPGDYPQIRFIPDKPVKRRAAQACLQCRNRKVRCDLVQSRGSCTNCRLDGVICEVVKCKRRKTNHWIDAAWTVAKAVTSESVSISFANEGTSAFNTLPLNANPIDTSRQRSLDVEILPLSVSGTESVLDGDQAPDQSHHLPRFIRPLSRELDAEDFRYLTAKGVFVLPPPELQNLILSRYAEFVHPLVPLLDLSEFLAIVAGACSKKISLLLYHAVMCAGLAAVESEYIVQHGYVSKPAARQEFYSKAKLLFDLDTDMDRLVVCQAALCFIGWSSNNHFKDAMYWSGIAISQAHSLRLQREDAYADLEEGERRLRRRLWWIVVMRECDVSLSMGRPPRIWPHGLRMLDHDDFSDRDPLEFEGWARIGEIRRDHVLLKRLEMACIEKAKLAVSVYRILHLPKEDAVNSNAKVWQLAAELKEWRLQLPPELGCLTSSTHALDETDRSLQISMSVVNLMHWMAVAVLHKAEVLLSGWTPSPGGDTTLSHAGISSHEHVRAMRHAANEITSVHAALHKQNLTQFLPAFGVATVCAAVFVHLLDARSSQALLRRTSLEHLDVCVDVLRELGHLNYTATDVSKIVESAAHAVCNHPLSSDDNSGGHHTRSNPYDPALSVSLTEGEMRKHLVSRDMAFSSAHLRDTLDTIGQTMGQCDPVGMENFFDFDMDEFIML